MTDQAITLVLDGVLVPVTNLFDAAGDECDCWEDAERFVAGPLPNGQWLADWTEKYVAQRSQ